MHSTPDSPVTPVPCHEFEASKVHQPNQRSGKTDVEERFTLQEVASDGNGQAYEEREEGRR